MNVRWSNVTANEVKKLLKKIEDDGLTATAVSMGYEPTTRGYFKKMLFNRANELGVNTQRAALCLKIDRTDAENKRSRIEWSASKCEEVSKYIKTHSPEEAAKHYNYSSYSALMTYLKRKIAEYDLKDDLSSIYNAPSQKEVWTKDYVAEALDSVAYFGAKETAAAYGFSNISNLNRQLTKSLHRFGKTNVNDIYEYLLTEGRLNAADYRYIRQSDVKYLKMLEEIDKTNLDTASKIMGYKSMPAFRTSLSHIKSQLDNGLFDGNAALAQSSFWANGKYEKAMKVMPEIGLLRTAAAFGFESVEGFSKSISRYELMIMD